MKPSVIREIAVLKLRKNLDRNKIFTSLYSQFKSQDVIGTAVDNFKKNLVTL